MTGVTEGSERWFEETGGRPATCVPGGPPLSERKPIDFDLFTDRHLLDLAQQVAAEIRRRQDAAQELVKDRGGLVEAEGPRYRNPGNASQTWSGRGRQPSWILDALAAGLTLNDLVCDDDRPAQTTRRHRSRRKRR